MPTVGRTAPALFCPNHRRFARARVAPRTAPVCGTGAADWQAISPPADQITPPRWVTFPSREPLWSKIVVEADKEPLASGSMRFLLVSVGFALFFGPALAGSVPCGKATCGLRRSTSSPKIQLHRVFRTPQRIFPRRPALGSVVPRKTNLRILCGRAFENRTRFVVQRTKQTSSAVRTHGRKAMPPHTPVKPPW